MSTQYQETKKPRILIIGSTGRIGSRVIAGIAKVDAVEAIYSSRTLKQVEAWHKDGKDAAFLDLDLAGSSSVEPMARGDPIVVRLEVNWRMRRPLGFGQNW